MRHITFGFLLGLPLLLMGQTSWAEDLKIGYVDVQRAIKETAEGQNAQKKLKSIFESKQKELDEKQNELKKKKEDFDKQRTILKADVLAQREKELQEQFMQLQATYMRLQKELSEKEAELMKSILGKMQGV